MKIDELNNLPEEQINNELFKCCGSTRWVANMLQSFPFHNTGSLFLIAEEKWQECSKEDWLEAFTHHPKIGDLKSLEKKFASTKEWAGGEQSGVNLASHEVLQELAEGNQTYEEKFGYIFIVCATDKNADEMLLLLKDRLENDLDKELRIAMKEQNKITILRLKKLLLS